jgi:hypothetical protein
MLGALHTLGRRRLSLLALPVATVAVHQLRYVLAYGPRAGHYLVAQGDAYVESMLPGLVLLLCVCAAMASLQVLRVARGKASAPSAGDARLPALWAGATAALLLAYVGQETLEVLLGSAHVSVLVQAFGDGGWWAGPAAILVGLAWALLARGVRAVLDLAEHGARLRRRRWPRDATLGHSRARGTALLAPRLRPLSRRLAGRGPPFGLTS